MTDYEWYLQSCVTNGIKPLSERRFAIFEADTDTAA